MNSICEKPSWRLLFEISYTLPQTAWTTGTIAERSVKQRKGSVYERRSEDERLVHKIRQGDQKAFEAIYDQYVDLVFSISARMLGRAEAEEVTQEVFLTLWQKADQFEKSRGSFIGWLTRMARNRSIDRLRKRQRQDDKLIRDQSFDVDILSGDQLETDAAAHQEIRAEKMREALTTIPPEQREVIMLAYFKGMTQSQISRHLDIPLGTVKKRVSLGLKKLKVVLKEEEVRQ
jgi:RNA polymerase sigma-70 factor (ECF subfamily)